MAQPETPTLNRLNEVRESEAARFGQFGSTLDLYACLEETEALTADGLSVTSFDVMLAKFFDIDLVAAAAEQATLTEYLAKRKEEFEKSRKP